MKKAQGLSMNVIVVAALALLVLVILAVIFIGRSGVFAKDVSACKGNCVAPGDCSTSNPDFAGRLVKQTNDQCFNPDGSLSTDVCCIVV